MLEFQSYTLGLLNGGGGIACRCVLCVLHLKAHNWNLVVNIKPHLLMLGGFHNFFEVHVFEIASGDCEHSSFRSLLCEINASVVCSFIQDIFKISK